MQILEEYKWAYISPTANKQTEARKASLKWVAETKTLDLRDWNRSYKLQQKGEQNFLSQLNSWL